jgi:outer membrane cobalamin receptor
MKRLPVHLLIFYWFFLSKNILAYPCPDSLYVVNQIQMIDAQKNNYRYFGDILSYIPGLWVRETGLPGQWSSARIWGCHENQVLVLIDGQVLNDPWTGAHDLNLVPVEMIEKIEIFPTMNPFAKSSIGGVVNIVSKDLLTNQPYTKIVYRSGKNTFSDLDVTFGQKITSKLEIISGVTLKKYGESIPSQKYSAQKTRAKIYYHPSANLSFRYSVLHNKYDLDLPYSFPVPGDTVLLTSPHRKRIQYNHLFQTDWNIQKITNSLRIEHTAISQEIYDKPLSLRMTFPVYQTGVQFQQGVSSRYVQLSWGAETQLYKLQIPDSTTFTESTTHGYLLGELSILPELQQLFQLHSHRSTDGNWTVHPAIQINWKPFAKFVLWSGYLQGVRDPSLGERFGYLDWVIIPETQNQIQGIEHSYPFIPNPSLKPEISYTADLGIQWNLTPCFQIKVRGYCRSIHDLIEINTSLNEWQYINRAENHFTGIEGQLHWNAWHDFNILFAFHAQKATDMNLNSLMERPNFISTTTLTWQHPFFKGDLDILLYLNYRFLSEYWNFVTENPFESYSKSNGPAHILDFKASVSIVKKGSFTFAVDNILDTEITMVSHFSLPGRSTRIGFAWELFE